MESRKIYKSGGSTYTISIPKGWIERQGLEAGDSLSIFVYEASLILEPPKARVTKEVLLDGTKASSSEALQRLVISHYLVGYDVLKVRLDPRTRPYKEGVRRVLERLTGAEVIEDLGDSLYIKVLLDDAKLPTIQVLGRISSLIAGMLSDARKALDAKDEELARGIMTREMEVDKLYFLLVRQLKKSVGDRRAAERLGIEHPRDALGFRVVAKSFERVGDHLEAMMQNYLDLLKRGEEDSVPKEVTKLLSEVARIYETSTSAFLERDPEKAEGVFQDLEGVRRSYEELVKELFHREVSVPSAILQRSMLESLWRIARYCSDVAEIALNMAAEVP